MKFTPVYRIPYLDGTEKVHQIIDASRGQAEAVERALGDAHMPPPNLDAAAIAARLSALEAATLATSNLPLVRASRSATITPPTAGTFHPLPWQSAVIEGQGVQHTPGTHTFRFQTHGYFQINYQGVLGGNDQLALALQDKAGSEITATGLDSTGGWVTVLLTWVLKVAPGDEIRTMFRVKGSTRIAVQPANTYVSIIGVRAV